MIVQGGRGQIGEKGDHPVVDSGCLVNLNKSAKERCMLEPFGQEECQFSSSAWHAVPRWRQFQQGTDGGTLATVGHVKSRAGEMLTRSQGNQTRPLGLK